MCPARWPCLVPLLAVPAAGGHPPGPAPPRPAWRSARFPDRVSAAASFSRSSLVWPGPGALHPRCCARIEAAHAGPGRRSHRGAFGGGVQARSRGPDLLHQGVAGRQVGSDSNSSQPGPDGAEAARVRKGEDWGLLLRREPKARLGDPPRTPSPGDFIVDLKTRGNLGGRPMGGRFLPTRQVMSGRSATTIGRLPSAEWEPGRAGSAPARGPTDRLRALSPGAWLVCTLPVLAVALLDRFGALSLKLYDEPTGSRSASSVATLTRSAA